MTKRISVFVTTLVALWGACSLPVHPPVLGFVPLFGQSVSGYNGRSYINGVGNGRSYSWITGWTWLQDFNNTFSNTCTVGASSCEISIGANNIIPTTSGSVWIVTAYTASNVTITGVSGGSGTWVTSSNFQAYSSSLGTVAAAYNVTGSGGFTGPVTVTFSGDSSTYVYVAFLELLPPSGYTGSFDNYATASSSSCTTCTGASPTLTAMDAVVHAIPAYNMPYSGNNPWSSPCFVDMSWTGDGGTGTCLNVNSASGAPTYTQPSGAFLDLALAFKSTAGSFSVRPPVFSVNSLTWTPSSNIGCSSSGCTVTVPSSTAGDLYFLMAGTGGSAATLTSVSLGSSSFTIPSGSNTCQIGATSQGTPYELSCAYLLSAPSNQTTVTMYTSASCNFGYEIWDIHRTSGSFALDTQNSATFSAANEVQGVPLTLSGANDVIFNAIINQGGINNVQYFPIPLSMGWFLGYNTSGFALLNTTNGTAPWYATNGQAGADFSIAFK